MIAFINLNPAKKLISEKKFVEAKQHLNLLASQGVFSAESLYLEGIIAHSQDQLPEAADFFKRSLQEDANYTDSAISLSIIYNDIGHYEEGKKYFQLAEKSLARKGTSSTHSILLDKEIAAKHIELGNLYQKIQRHDEAANEYLKALRVDPESVEASTKLAHTHSTRGQSQLAIAELQKIIQRFPQHPETRVQLAMVYFANGNFADAQMELTEALKQDPENPQANMYLALAQDATESTI